MSDVLVGIVLVVIGLAVAFLGARMFFFALPIWGFLAGFFLGASAFHGAFGDSFLSTVGGWIIGLVLGLIFAAFAYLYWYLGAIFAAGSAGALIGSGLMGLFNVETGWVVTIVAAIFGAAAILIAWMWRLPIYIVVVNTGIVGALAAVAGIVLIFDRKDLDEFGYGAAWAAIHDGWFWSLAWIAVAAVGIWSQLSQLEGTFLPENRWIRADANARQMSALASDRESRI